MVFVLIFRFFINGFYPFNCFSIYLLFLSLSVCLPYVCILPSFSLFIIRLSPYLFYSLIIPSSLSHFPLHLSYRFSHYLLSVFLYILLLHLLFLIYFFFLFFFYVSSPSSSSLFLSFILFLALASLLLL